MTSIPFGSFEGRDLPEGTEPGDLLTVVRDEATGVLKVEPVSPSGDGGSSSSLAIVAVVAVSDSAVAPATPGMQPVPFDIVRYDPDSLWDGVAFVFNIAETGWYQCGVYYEGTGGIISDNCFVGGRIQVNGDGQNIVQPSGFVPSTDAAAHALDGWSGITHLDSGDSVELDLYTGSSTGTEEDPSMLVVAGAAFYILMVRPGT